MLPATFAELVELVGGGAASAIDGAWMGSWPVSGSWLSRTTLRTIACRCSWESRIGWPPPEPVFRSCSFPPGAVPGRGSQGSVHSSSMSPSRAFAYQSDVAPHSSPGGSKPGLRAHRPTILLMAGFSPFVAHRTSRIARELGAALGVWSGDTPRCERRSLVPVGPSDCGSSARPTSASHTACGQRHTFGL